METRSTIAEKLDPIHFPEMSGGMTAFVGYVVEERFTDPVIAEMVIKRGVVYSRCEGESEFERFAPALELYASWQALLNAAGLSDNERNFMVEVLAHRVQVILEQNPSATEKPLRFPSGRVVTPAIEAIVEQHLREPDLTKEGVLEEIEAAGF
jgi:hypothetical protein